MGQLRLRSGAGRPGRRLRPGRGHLIAGLLAGLLTLAACGSPATRSQPAPVSGATVWLCRPGATPDPCTTSLKATVVPPQGAPSVNDPAPDTSSRFDCFYIYPTVSQEESMNASRQVQMAEIEAAKAQAAPFSTVCRVWSPIYRQVTAPGLVKLFLSGSGAATRKAYAVAYSSLQAAFEDYLHHHNGGRPIVILAHSQGAVLAIELLQKLFDESPAMRKRLIMAVILGGNVTVESGSAAGGTFSHIPACTRMGQDGCVLAYSSFGSQPPPNAYFGYPRAVPGTETLRGQSPSGHQVLCVNPAAVNGGIGVLQPWFPASGTDLPTRLRITTPWVIYPHLYTAQCRHAGGATWLQVTPIPGSVGERPLISESKQVTAQFGYHVGDVNLATGNLLADVAAAERSRPG